jgi:hypothetical protein
MTALGVRLGAELTVPGQLTTEDEYRLGVLGYLD